MSKRQWIISALAIPIVFLGFAGMFGLFNMKKTPERKADNRTARAINVVIVENRTEPMLIPVNGKVTATNKVEIFPEVTGVLMDSGKRFRVGQTYRKGEVMIAVDGRENLLNLKAQRSAFKAAFTGVLPDIKLDYASSFAEWQSFTNDIQPDKTLPALPESSNQQLMNFLSARGLFQQYYSIQSMENRQSKFTIYAPYDCTVSLGELNPGTLVRAGQKVGEVISSSGYELEAAVAESDLGRLQPGDVANLRNGSREYTSKVMRIGRNIDPQMQRVQVFLSISGEDIQDGMYLEGTITVDSLEQVYPVGRNLLIESDKLYVVNDTLLNLRIVEVVHEYEENLYVRGLSNGDRLVDQVLDGAYENMWVQPKTGK
ncbi:MAG: HlyD family efflux transporter periplasmic adaptor subunit [Flavobacteriales bacterium]|nr:HlyD family efflux transporter periplasmic adaptor subunit [Flavobacteriales bacterium]